MVIKRERLKVHVSSHAEMGVWDELRQHFTAYLHDVKASYWKALQLSFLESGERVPAEIYLAHPGILMYYTVDPQREYIEAGCFLPQGEGTQAFQGFCERIKDAILPGYKDREPLWKPHVEVNPTFELVREEARRLTPGEDQLAGATALADPNRRHLLRTVQAQRSCLLESLATGRSLMEIGPDLQMLEELGLLQREFVVFCRENGNQITRVGNFSQIEEATRRGFKCFSCGRPIAEERIDQILACTSHGEVLAGHNYWLAQVVSAHLEELGIQTDQQLALDSAGNRTMQVFGHHDGMLVMVEVREDTVGLDDVFVFFSHVGYYRPDLAFYLTTRPVAPEVRKYIQTPCGVPVVLVEDPDDLERAMREVLDRLQLDRVQGVIEGLEPLTNVDVGQLVFEHFFGRETHPEEILEIAEAISEPVEAPVERAPLAPVQGVPGPLEGLGRDMPAVVPVGLQEGLDVGMSHGEVAPPIETVPAQEEPLPMAEAIGLGVSAPAPGAGDLAPVDLGLQMQMTEEVLGLDTPIMGIEEVFDLTEVVAVEKSPEEEHEQLVRRVIDDVAQNGVLGRERVLQAHLGEIDAMPGVTSAFVADDGLILVESLDPETAPELTAAVAAELFESVRRGLEELAFSPATRVQVDSFGDRLRIRPAGEGVLLVLREERPTRDNDDEAAGSLPGEMVLREAMLKKVLEDLSLIEGVRGSMVAGRDGLLIEAQIENEEMPPVLPAVLSQILVDNEKHLQKAHLHPLRQISIRTADRLFALIPLDREGILIAILDPTTPREVWQNRLTAAASMLTSVFQ